MQESGTLNPGSNTKPAVTLPAYQKSDGLENAVITIVGVGLISGSFAIAMKEKGFAKKVIGVSRTEASLIKAKALGIIDEALSLEEAVAQSDFIYVAIPVDATLPVMDKIMNLVTEKQIVVDAGSTKFVLCEALAEHPMRKRFVATHPMWGTEYSGPEAAVRGAFEGRACVICERKRVMLQQWRWWKVYTDHWACILFTWMHTATIYMLPILVIFRTLLHLLWQIPYWKKKKKRILFLNWQVVVLKVQ